MDVKAHSKAVHLNSWDNVKINKTGEKNTISRVDQPMNNN